MLLSDWVFSQYQPAVKAVIGFVTERPQFTQLLANAEGAGTSYWSGLPDRSGRLEFLNVLWSYAEKMLKPDQMRGLARAICENSSMEERVERWTACSKNIREDDWVHLGELLGIFSSDAITSVPEASEDKSTIVKALVRARQFAELERSSRLESAKSILLNDIIITNFAIKSDPNNQLAWLARQLNCFQYAIVFHEEMALPLGELLARRRHISHDGFPEEMGGWEPSISEPQEFQNPSTEAYNRFLEYETQILATTLQPWTDLVETLRSSWGDCRAIDRIAFLAAGVRNTAEIGYESSLHQTDQLVQSARFVRLKSGAPQWWMNTLQDQDDQIQRRRYLHLMALWASPKTIIKISTAVDEALASLDEKQWSYLVSDYNVTRIRNSRRDYTLSLSEDEETKFFSRSPRFQTFVGQRLSSSLRLRSALEIAKHDKLGTPERRLALRAFTEACREGSWDGILPSVEKLYTTGPVGLLPLGNETTMPQHIAELISSRPENFPLSWVALADGSLRSIAGENACKLLEVAKRDEWFQDGTGGIQ